MTLNSTSFIPKKISRTGVYGVAIQDGKMLLIRQQFGPYAGKFDFPGGGMEFGETAEQALRRELIEEVAMEFDSLEHVDNLTATIEVAGTSSKDPYSFYQIGLIYRLHGCQSIQTEMSGEMEPLWIDLSTLNENECSKLLWKFRMSLSETLESKKANDEK